MYTKKLVFKGTRRIIHVHQRAFKAVVGDPFAQYWCIDFGLLKIGNENQPEVFLTEVFSWTSARDVHPKMLVFPGFGGPDRSFWPDVRRDIRAKTSSLG